jgi:hypothetical protein
MPQTPAQTLINTGADSSLATIYPENAQQIPLVGNASIYITNKTEFTTNIINQDVAGGDSTEVQFNIGDRLVGDVGFTYDLATDTLTVDGNVITGNAIVGNVKTDNLKYSNGSPWVFSGTYSNSNVANYLPTFTGNITGNNITGTRLFGNAAGVTAVPGANVTGTVANATYATSAGSATTAGNVVNAAQPNITSVGNLVSLESSGNISASLFLGSGANLNNLNAANISGAVANANYATYSGTAYSISGSNVTGAVGTANLANYATTVTDANQSNITSLGSLSSLTVTGLFTSNGGITMNLDSQLVLGNTTDSTNPTSGAIRVSGGIGSNANIHAKGFHSTGNMYAQSILFAGNGAANTSLTNPVIVGKNIGNQYLQIALINGSNTGSSDYVAYGDNGTETEAWADLGFTSGGFNDANYTITDKNDGYLFVQGGQDNTGFIGGNLVIATGNVGKTGYRDIIFATNGFLTTNERFRYSHANNALVPGANATMDLGNTTRYFGNIFSNNITLTSNITSGNASLGNLASANYFSGNGQALTSIAGANVTGFVANANVANTAFAVAAANVSGLGNIATINLDGNVSNLLTGSGTYVAIPTVPTVGNIATINLDGSSSNVLYGNGVFAAVSGGSYGDSNVSTLLGSFGSNSISTTGNVTANNFSGNTNGFTIGYLDVPQVSASNTTLALGDAGKHYYSTTAGNLTLTVPLNSSVAFATGTAISIVVQAAGNLLVNAASGVTLYMAGNSSAANRVVGGYGMATLLKVASDTWFINGTGVA